MSLKVVCVVLGFLVIIGANYSQSASSPVIISIAQTGLPGNGNSKSPSISGDGRWIAFASGASNLVQGDLNGQQDVFVFDQLNQQTMRVSMATDGSESDGISSQPVISANGRWVVFESTASNLVQDDTNGFLDVFAHDLLTGKMVRVSEGPNGEQANATSFAPSVSADGRYIAFLSEADNLIRNDENQVVDAFIKDQVTGNVINASVSSSGIQSNAPVGGVKISGDSRFVVFASAADNLVPQDTNNTIDIFIYNRVLARIERASVGTDSRQANDWSALPSVSFSGRYVLFVSQAGNLKVSGGAGLSFYLRDRQLNSTQELINLPGPFDDLISYAGYGDFLTYFSPGSSDDSKWIAFNINTKEKTTIASGDVHEGDISLDGKSYVFSKEINGLTQIYEVNLNVSQEYAHFVSGKVVDETGMPLALVTIKDQTGNSTRTGMDGYYLLDGYKKGDEITLIPEKDGYQFLPEDLQRMVSDDMFDNDFSPAPTEALAEARLNLGMPYSFYRGCQDPFRSCGGPFHGFFAGFCSDLVLDAYSWGLDFNIQFALESDANAHPEHYYRWRNARNTHDMWRYFSYSGQMMSHDQPYQPGDIVFFDWSGDGEIDHVAIVSEINDLFQPVKMLDATGVIASNPGGLASELPWENFHETTVRGHARWSGAYEPYVASFPIGVQSLQMALGGDDVNLRVVDEKGKLLTENQREIPGGIFYNLVWEKIISVMSPRVAGSIFTVDIDHPGNDIKPYQFTVHTMQDGFITDRVTANGVLWPGETKNLRLEIGTDSEGKLTLLKVRQKGQPKVRGILIKP